MGFKEKLMESQKEDFIKGATGQGTDKKKAKVKKRDLPAKMILQL